MVNLWDPAKKEEFEAHDQFTRSLHKQYLEHLHTKPELNLKRVQKELQREESLAQLEPKPLAVINQQSQEPEMLNEGKEDLYKAKHITLNQANKKSTEDEVMPSKIDTLNKNVFEGSPLPIKAVDERAHLEEENRKVKLHRRLYKFASLVSSSLLSSAIAFRFAPVVSDSLPLSPPVWFSALIIMIIPVWFTSLQGWNLAKSWQIKREQNRIQNDPNAEIAEIALLKPILKKEKNLSSEEIQNEVKIYLNLRWENKSLEDVNLEFKVAGIISLIMIFGQLVFSVINGFDGILTGFVFSVLGAAALAGTLLPLSSLSLDNKELPAFTLYDPIEAEEKKQTEQKEFQKKTEKEKKEAELKLEQQRLDTEKKLEQEKQIAERKQRAEKAELEKQQQLLLKTKIDVAKEQHADLHREKSQDFEQKRSRIYLELRDAASKWETLKGFEIHEIEHMAGMRAVKKKFLYFLIVPSSAILSLVATYPASIVTSELLDLRYVYTTLAKFAPMPWLIWMPLVLLAEWVIAAQLVKIRHLDYENSVLMNGYDLTQRKKGLPYKVLDHVGFKQKKRMASIWLLGGFFTLLIEFIVNALYIFMYAESSFMAYAISFVPLCLLVLFAFLAANHKEPLEYLNDALGYEKVDINALRQRVSAPQRDLFRPVVSRDLIHDMENNIGPRPLGSARKNNRKKENK